jgi:NAD(P)-dependent dehydrogenase (short-subunit alcohol dehydrogenase family)
MVDESGRLVADWFRDISSFMQTPLPGLDGKVALVTGHAQGIGRAIFDLLAENGSEVYGIDLPEHDLKDLDRIADWVDTIAAKAGRIDILVNNAGITNVGDILETPLAELEDVLTVNFKAPFMMMKAVLPHMLQQKSGSIVNNASDQALIGKRHSAVYGASKAALAQLTKSAALDWGSHGIRINCIAPGSTDTPMLRRVLGELHQRYPDDYPEDVERRYRESVALKRLASPGEIAWLVAFLASDASSFMTGTVIPIDGGFTAQ